MNKPQKEHADPQPRARTHAHTHARTYVRTYVRGGGRNGDKERLFVITKKTGP